MNWEGYVEVVKGYLRGMGYEESEVVRFLEWNRTVVYEYFMAGLSAEFTARSLM